MVTHLCKDIHIKMGIKMYDVINVYNALEAAGHACDECIMKQVLRMELGVESDINVPGRKANNSIS